MVEMPYKYDNLVTTTSIGTSARLNPVEAARQLKSQKPPCKLFQSQNTCPATHSPHCSLQAPSQKPLRQSSGEEADRGKLVPVEEDTSLPVKNAKVTRVLEERQIKVGSHSLSAHISSQSPPPLSFTRHPAHLAAKPTPLRLCPDTFNLAMWHMLLLSGLLAGVPPWGACAPWEINSDDGQPQESAVVTLNDSCRAEVLWRAASAMLQQLRLDRPPRIAASAADQAHETWAKVARELPTLSSQGQYLDIFSNQTLLIRRGSCIQISYRIMMDDLGWQTWVLHPSSFVFTECLGCQCHKKEKGQTTPVWMQECGLLGQPNHQPTVDSKQARCCRPRRTSISFVFLQEDGTLVVRAPRLDRDCHCQP
ncbi:uncharacterized protein LOC132579523 [Heteronotia binoei]|uniref:uncharacterized protein LOC132579523 n=1 Tax=Heteronotia binoei TaxID=13085 RepID=UPI00292CF823|nr:uncharacterized protein LOC132579523 [Heteronotia binoei]